MDGSKPVLLFDTDMDTDCDDAGALAMLLNAVKRNEIRLLGIVADAPVKEAAPCCEAFCRFYGMDVPVAAVSRAAYEQDQRFNRYRTHRMLLQPERYYNRVLAESVRKTDADYPSAVKQYRKWLSESAENEVTILCVGFLTALAELLDSKGDEISALDGTELVRRKVKRVISMGELPEKEEHCTSFNYAMDLIGTETVFQKCPVPVWISSYGSSVITGSQLTDQLPPEHPLRMAYECWNGPRKGRSSWDLLAVLHALQPETLFQRRIALGRVHVNANEQRMWIEPKGDRMDQLILPAASDEELANLLNRMMIE